jgi:hypothetical protein
MGDTGDRGTSLDGEGLLDGLLNDKQLEAAMGWQSRTRLRREAEGLPVIVLGVKKLYPIDQVRAWLLSRVRQHQPVRRGRPRA